LLPQIISEFVNSSPLRAGHFQSPPPSGEANTAPAVLSSSVEYLNMLSILILGDNCKCVDVRIHYSTDGYQHVLRLSCNLIIRILINSGCGADRRWSRNRACWACASHHPQF